MYGAAFGASKTVRKFRTALQPGYAPESTYFFVATIHKEHILNITISQIKNID